MSPFFVYVPLFRVNKVQGRVSDQNGRPIAGANIAAYGFWKPTETGFSEPTGLFPDTAAAFTTDTAADGSFVLKGIPQSSLAEVKIASQGRAPATIAWNTAQPGNIMLDRRLGRIKTIADLDALWFSEDDLRRDPESGETTGARGDCAVHLRKRLSVGLRRIEAPVLVG
jgi:hypothetical protein